MLLKQKTIYTLFYNIAIKVPFKIILNQKVNLTKERPLNSFHKLLLH